MKFLKDIFKNFKQNDLKTKKSFSYLNQLNPMDIWDVVGEIGDGAFGKVYKGKNKENGDIAALKQVELEEEGDLEEYIVEIEILTECKHANIINLYAAYNFESKLWMALEFCNGGALDSLMVDLDKGLSESAIKYVAKEVLSGLIFLHEHRVIHRDMKAGNILVTKEAHVKLADFGVSAKMAMNQQKRNTVQGTPYWMAPEVICCQNMDSYYDCRADIWSFGITLIEMAQMRPPYHQMQPNRVLLKIAKSEPPTLDRPKNWSLEFNNFLKMCLTKDAEKRPFGPELFTDQFVTSTNDANKKALRLLIYEAKSEDIQETVEDLDLLQRKSMIQNGDLDDVARELYTETEDNSSVASSDVHSSLNEKLSPLPYKKDNLREVISKEILDTIIDGQINSVNEKHSIPGAVCESMEDYNPKTNIDEAIKSLPDKKILSRNDSMREAMLEQQIVSPGSDTISEETEKDSDLEDKNKDSPSGFIRSNANGQQNINRKRSCYRTMTRTRKFIVDGEEMISVDKKIVREGREREVIDEINHRKEVIRGMKMLAKEESRQMRQIHFKNDLEKSELEARLKQDEINMERNYEIDIDKLAKDHKTQLEKMENQNFKELKKFQQKLLTDKANKENDFKNKEKQRFESDLNKLPKSERRDKLKLLKEAHNTILQESLRNLTDNLERNINDEIENISKANRKEISKNEIKMLEEKYKRKRKFDEDIINKTKNDCHTLYQQEKQHYKDLYMLKRQQMKHRQEKEMELLFKENKKELDDLDTIQLAERRSIPRMIKTVSRTRLTQKRAEMMILLEKNIINQTEMKQRLKEFTDAEKEREKKDQSRKEGKLNKLRQDLLNDHAQRNKENDQTHAAQKKELTDLENETLRDLDRKQRERLDQLDKDATKRKEDTNSKYEEELEQIKKFYSSYENSNGSITPYRPSELGGNASLLAPKSNSIVHRQI